LTQPALAKFKPDAVVSATDNPGVDATDLQLFGEHLHFRTSGLAAGSPAGHPIATELARAFPKLCAFTTPADEMPSNTVFRWDQLLGTARSASPNGQAWAVWR